VRQYIPGQIDYSTLKTLRELQVEHLEAITEHQDETDYRDRMHVEWVRSCYRGGMSGARD
jgi:hypothetical protein